MSDILSILLDRNELTNAEFFDGVRSLLTSIEPFENGYFNDRKHTQNIILILPSIMIGDGLFNYYEMTLGTRPNFFDSDGDGWSDGAELAGKFT